MKILTIVGARPQFIKAAAISREISKHKDIKEVILHTGQHFDKNMSDVFFKQLKIPNPNYNLNICNLSQGAMVGEMLKGIEEVLIQEKPDYVLVYGDTNSTIAGALAAKKLFIKVAHVEAGLRSYNMRMPEEINRILTDRISNILFCPTEQSVENLIKEGFENFDCKVVKSGDVMYDSALYYKNINEEQSDIISRLDLKDFILCTIHREENTDNLNKLQTIIEGLNRINREIKIILPLHPRTKEVIKRNNIKVNFEVIEPISYFDIIKLLSHCKLVMTDSGGLQKEAFFFKKNCIVLREETEWIELTENGFCITSGTDSDKIYQCYKDIINKTSDFNMNLYGRGDASKIIVKVLNDLYN